MNDLKRIAGLLAVAVLLVGCATGSADESAAPTAVPVTLFAPPTPIPLAKAKPQTPVPAPLVAQAPATEVANMVAESTALPATPEPLATDPPVAAPQSAPQSAPQAAPANPTPAQAEARPLSDSNYFNVRSAPNLQASVLARVSAGGFVRVVGRNSAGDWYAVEYTPGAIGYVSSSAASVLGDVSLLPVMEPVAPVAAAPAAAAAAVQSEAKSAAPAMQASTASGCPASSGNSYDLIPRDSGPADRPDREHGDLNLALRSYSPASESPALVGYNGGTDPDAPQFSGVFVAARMAAPVSAYRVNLWRFESNQCSGAANGCRGPSDNTWPVTLLGLAATPGEALAIPSRNALVYSNANAMVLYADERRLTLGYTRQDTIAAGYAVYLENICVDPNLLALYRAQVGPDGYRASDRLPGLRNGQPLGTAASGEVIVGVRDNASWMDPRSRKDWWQR